MSSSTTWPTCSPTTRWTTSTSPRCAAATASSPRVVSRLLYERAYAGVRFGSNLDDQPCYALFEGRAELLPDGEPLELTPDLEPLRRVCDELGLTLA
jgi:hypothetical protein